VFNNYRPCADQDVRVRGRTREEGKGKSNKEERIRAKDEKQ
jgi:hypothetical protein